MSIIKNIDRLNINKGSYKDVDEAIANLQDADLAPKKYVDNNRRFIYNQIQVPFRGDPFIPIDVVAYTFREHSNIIFSEILGKYVFAWSQGERPYNGTNVSIHLAISDELHGNWDIIGEVIGESTNNPSEDPFLVEENGFLYIIAENKSDSVPTRHDDISLWKLTDMNDLENGWSYLGKMLEKDTTKEWQSKDVSSPTYLMENGISYLFFEGRGYVNNIDQNGAVGLAISNNGIEGVFTQEDLIISGSGFDGKEPDSSWAKTLVPDDIWKIGDLYYLSCHSEFQGSYYTSILQSRSIESGWSDYLGSHITYSNRDRQTNGSGAPFFNGFSVLGEGARAGISAGYFLCQWGVSETPILASPDGNSWRITVDNNGGLSAEQL